MNENNLLVILDALAEQIKLLKSENLYKDMRIENLEKELTKAKEGKAK